MDEDDPRIAKLPAWARKHIATLQRERDAAIKQYQSFVAAQPESPFYHRTLSPIASGRLPDTHYLQTYTVGCRRRDLTVELTIRVEEPGIQVRFDSRLGVGRTVIVPECSNGIRIVEIPRGIA
jgi:hypothetical protein